MNTQERKRIERVIEIAHSLIGSPYKYGAYLLENRCSTKEFDCSSFIQHIFKPAGIGLPRSTILQAAHPGIEVSGKGGDIIMPGDVIFFEGTRGYFRHDLFPDRKIYIGHVGISVGNSYVIHATDNFGVSGVVKQSIIHIPNPPYSVSLVKRFIY